MDYAPVTHTQTERQLGTLPSGSGISVTVHRYTGGDGPTVYVQAAQHGIELNGPATIRRLHEEILDTRIAGTVVAVPVVNPPAFDHRSYTFPAEYDVVNPNLNRVWPGDPDGSFQERIASRLWELVADVDLAIDLHTGTPDMLEHVRVRSGQSTARSVAEAFGTEYLLVDEKTGSKGDDGFAEEHGEKFRDAAISEGVPAFTVELANSRRVARPAIDTGIDGIRNALRAIDVLEGDRIQKPDQTVLRDDLPPAVASESGLFEPRQDIGVGDRVQAGEELGTIYSPSSFEPLQAVTVENGGVIYSLRRESVIIAGERVVAIGNPV